VNALGRRVRCAVAATLAGLAVGCTGSPIRVGSVDPERGLTDFDLEHGRRVEAKATGFQVLLFLPIQVNSRHERAWQIILRQADRGHVTDVEIEEIWAWALVGTLYTTRIRATIHPLRSE
jgi:hypothetical protein